MTVKDAMVYQSSLSSRASSAHLAEPNQKVLGDLPEDIHIHDSSLVATLGAPVHHRGLSCRGQDVPIPEEVQAPPLHCCGGKHGCHAHQEAPPCRDKQVTSV